MFRFFFFLSFDRLYFSWFQKNVNYNTFSDGEYECISASVYECVKTSVELICHKPDSVKQLLVIEMLKET